MSSTLTLHVEDVTGRKIKDTGSIQITDRETGRVQLFSGLNFAGGVAMQGIDPGLYDIWVRPKSYRGARQFVTVRRPTKRLTMTVLVKPTKVQPMFSSPLDERIGKVLQRSQLYFNDMTPLQKAGLLNIATKSFVCPILDRTGLIDHVTIRRVFRDRVFCDVHPDLPMRVELGAFTKVSGSRHKPPNGFRLHSSWKTKDVVGNLQMTFFTSKWPSKTAQSDVVADIDIDNSSGLAHAFDVMRHTLTGKGTHPYDIHDILVHWQGLDPGYRLEPK